jgi:hypothetical protein
MVQHGGMGKKLGIGTFLGAALAVLGASSATDAKAAETATISTATTNLTRIPVPTFVSIACQNPGSSQDVAKTPVLKNTALTTLYKGQKLSWSSSDGDMGQVILEADLAPGATVKAMGKPGNAYTCQSSYMPRPDLKIRLAKLVTTSQASVEVQNADPYVGASASAVFFEVRSCNTNAVLASSKSSTVALAKGEVKALTFTFANPVSGKTYLRAVADTDKVVSESNELNNLWNSQNSCLY